MLTTKRKPATVGEILAEEFMRPMGLTQGALADAMGHEVARGRVRRIARGVYEIDPDAPRSRWRDLPIRLP